MRGIIQEKLTEDQNAAIKEREKTKALFNEVVRLGEQQERTAELLQNNNFGLETRVQSMESKLQASERAFSSLAQRGETGLSQINDWNDKVDKKLANLETTFYQLGVRYYSSFLGLIRLKIERATTRSRHYTALRSY